MKKLTITMILIAIIALCTASYFILIKFSRPDNVFKYPAPPMVELTSTLSATSTPAIAQTSQCTPDEVSAIISTQGAAGNIYAKLTITNTGKTACEIDLGNTVIAIIDDKYILPQNIAIHFMQRVHGESAMLAPGEKVYSQVHYPNGPQCQTGVAPKQITFLLDQSTVVFKPDPQTGNLMLQACSSDTEKTTIDIWPLSKSPIMP